MGTSEYNIDLEINEYALEVECADQPRLFMKWAERFAFALFERDKAKQDLKVIVAKTSLLIRNSDPRNFGLDKWTEGSIQAIIDSHPDVLNAEDKHLEAVKNAELLRGARDAFDDRKKQLVNLVSLRNAQYYADPTKELEIRERLAQEAQRKTLQDL